MNAAVSIVLLAAVLGVIVFLLSRRENTRRSQYGPAGLSEFRTDLPLDDCFDRLDQHSPDDVFAYECRRENDGSFLLHLTLHQPSQQPLDTLYTLRLDPGRQTHHAAKCIQFTYQRSFCRSTNAGIAGHIADGIQAHGKNSRLRAQCGRRMGRFNARMARTNHDDVIISQMIHVCFPLFYSYSLTVTFPHKSVQILR